MVQQLTNIHFMLLFFVSDSIELNRRLWVLNLWKRKYQTFQWWEMFWIKKDVRIFKLCSDLLKIEIILIALKN